MHTLTLVVILILSNIVPPAIAKFNFWDLFRWNRRTTTAPPNRWQIKNHTYIKPMCVCQGPTIGGYIRLKKYRYRWYYNNKTQKCQHILGIPGNCNNFDNKDVCLMRCEIPIRLLRRKNKWP
uniref:Pancreatic trypsin inhibitor n=1 Tax=Rhipicephalus appendiculatus TaxID=34631 RepID=A0A131YQX9_RHIAP